MILWWNSFEGIISKNAFDIMKLAYRDLYVTQHYHHIHDPDELVNAIKSFILLLLGLPIILETLLRNFRKRLN